MSAAANDRGACMLVLEFVGPVPDVADHIHDAEWTGSIGMRIDIGWRRHDTRSFFERRHSIYFRAVPPRIGPAVVALRRVLPFPFMRQSLAGPLGVFASVF